ncbi:hypothetical protein DUNSADRAFT_10180, partial [Dunaliella salina]
MVCLLLLQTYLLVATSCNSTGNTPPESFISKEDTVGYNDDNGGTKLSRVTFHAAPDTDYFIIVEGAKDLCGHSDVRITVLQDSPPPPPPSPTPPPPPSP